MKKKILYVLGICFAAISISACGSDKEEDGPTPPNNQDVAKYDPATYSEPEYLEINAKRALDMFNSADQKPLIQLLNEAADSYEEYSWPFDDDTFSKGARKIARAAQYQPTAIYTYVYEYTIELSRIAGVYEPNNRYGRWEKTANSNDFIARFPYNGRTAELKVSGADGNWQYHYEDVYEDYYEKETTIVNINIPKTLRLTLTDGTTTMMDFTVKTNFVEDRNVSASINGKAMNLTVKASVNADNSNISETSEVWVNNYQLASTSANITGRRFCSPSQWEDYEGQIFDSGKTTVYVANGAIRVEANCSKLEEAAEYIDDCYESGNEAKRAANALNSLITNQVYFNGYSQQVARIGWEAQCVYKSYYYEDWEVIPNITFLGNNGGTYQFEDYFDGRTFGGVVDSFNSLVKTYRKLWK